MKSLNLAFAFSLLAAAAFGQDAIQFPQVIASPAVSSFKPTVHITQVHMDPRGGVELSFDHPLPKSWNCRLPGWDGDLQFTVWAFVPVNGHWDGAGMIQMWEGRSMTDGSLPAILTGYKNWWADARHPWGEMSDYVPKANDSIGFMVSACSARMTTDVTGIPERSNIVVVPLPAGDFGTFNTTIEPQQPPVPPYNPEPLPPVPDPEPDHLHSWDLTQLLSANELVRVAVEQLRVQEDANTAKIIARIDKFQSDVNNGVKDFIKNYLPMILSGSLLALKK